MSNMTPEESKMFAEFVRSEMATGESPATINPINDGGTAFSVADSHLTTGMSLRAYIAAKAMQSIIGWTPPDDAAKYNPDDLQFATARTARAACGYADALIAELGKEGK